MRRVLCKDAAARERLDSFLDSGYAFIKLHGVSETRFPKHVIGDSKRMVPNMPDKEKTYGVQAYFVDVSAYPR